MEPLPFSRYTCSWHGCNLQGKPLPPHPRPADADNIDGLFFAYRSTVLRLAEADRRPDDRECTNDGSHCARENPSRQGLTPSESGRGAGGRAACPPYQTLARTHGPHLREKRGPSPHPTPRMVRTARTGAVDTLVADCKLSPAASRTLSAGFFVDLRRENRPTEHLGLSRLVPTARTLAALRPLAPTRSRAVLAIARTYGTYNGPRSRQGAAGRFARPRLPPRPLERLRYPPGAGKRSPGAAGLPLHTLPASQQPRHSAGRVGSPGA